MRHGQWPSLVIMQGSKISVVIDKLHLGVVHNCHHFHERTQRTLGEGVKGDRTLF